MHNKVVVFMCSRTISPLCRCCSVVKLYYPKLFYSGITLCSYKIGYSSEEFMKANKRDTV